MKDKNGGGFNHEYRPGDVKQLEVFQRNRRAVVLERAAALHPQR